MQTFTANQELRSKDLEWYLLGEYSSSQLLPDPEKSDEITTGLLSQAMREWGIPPEYLENIELTFIGFAKEALAHFEQGSLELPGRIRLFCHKKVIDDANSTKTARLDHAEQTMEQGAIEHPSGTILDGGWGYFIIERSGYHACSSERSRPFVDLYLYREGE